MDLALQVTGAFSPWPKYGGGGSQITLAYSEARRLMEESRSFNTRQHYARDWRLFVTWMAEQFPDKEAFPSHPASVGLYIGYLRTCGLAKQTIICRLAAIAYAHELGSSPSPLKHPEIYREIRGLRRQFERPKQERKALVRETATEMLQHFGGQTLKDIRDRSIFTLAWCSALRRSNIAALNCEDVTLCTDPVDNVRYLELNIVKSKTDQEGKGRRLPVTEMPSGDPLCAVRAYEAWIEASKLSTGPLYRTFNSKRVSRKSMTSNPIDGRDVSRVVKRLCDAAGIDSTQFAAHSLRRGFVTSADEAGVRRSLIREQGGWKDDRMIATYTKVEQVKDNALRAMFTKTESQV